jgi:hypothetical protein
MHSPTEHRQLIWIQLNDNPFAHPMWSANFALGMNQVVNVDRGANLLTNNNEVHEYI